MATEKHQDDFVLDATAIDKIDHFLKPKRREQAFSILSPCGMELAQGDYAVTMKVTATSLSNILAAYSNFEYKLLEVNSVGKYRFYKLSPLGRAYLKAKANAPPADSGDCCDESQEFLHEARTAVDALTRLLPDSWEVGMSRLLDARIYGRDTEKVKQKFGLEDEALEQAERALDRYLTCVERAEFQNNSVMLNQILDLLPNMILRDLISDIVNVFSQFSTVIGAISDGKKSVYAYMMVKNAFGTPSESEVEKYAKLLGWDGKTFEALRETAKEMRKNISHLAEEEEVCRYFLHILPGQRDLCMYIARCICGDR